MKYRVMLKSTDPSFHFLSDSSTLKNDSLCLVAMFLEKVNWIFQLRILQVFINIWRPHYVHFEKLV